MKKIIILLVVIVSCNPPKVSDPSFNEMYVKPFIAQAESYGVRIVNAPLTVIYVDDLRDNGFEIAGRAEYDTQTITFNTSHEMWNSEAKIILIYHELAHYYLNKAHVDESVSCDVPFSIMSLWNESSSPIQYEYWVTGKWRENEDYYFEEIFLGSKVWSNYPDHENIYSHNIESPCWN